jgi:predicted regulator of amino acid metabolism with ACT domain
MEMCNKILQINFSIKVVHVSVFERVFRKVLRHAAELIDLDAKLQHYQHHHQYQEFTNISSTLGCHITELTSEYNYFGYSGTC